MPSTYTHDPASGSRVSQFAPTPKPESNQVSDFRTSGYTHTRSSLNFGASADNYHRVESWGDPVRPYGEWRFPFRPYSTPYANWGAPYAGLNSGFGGIGGGFGFGGNFGNGVGQGRRGFGNANGQGFSGGFNGGFQQGGLNPYPIGPGSAYRDAPYFDGFYPNNRQ